MTLRVSPSSAPAVGGTSTPGSSPAGPTASWSRSPARTPESAARRAAEFGTTPYTDLDAMVAETRPDLVTVCLPNEGHFEPTRRLIDAGVNLLVEKPLVFDLAEADELLDRAAQQGIFFGINFNHRYAEPVQRAHQAIQDGVLGDLLFLTWRFGGEANYGDSPHANLIETQCHGFDMLEHLGGPISSVAAQMTDKTYGAYSTVALALAFESGRRRHHARQLRLVVRLSGQPADRGQRHHRPRHHPRHGPAAHPEPGR